MSLLIATALLATALPQGQTQPAIATFKFLDRQVQVTAPAEPDYRKPLPTFDLDGWRFRVDTGGSIVSRERARDLKSDYDAAVAANPQPIEWPTKIVIFTRSDGIDKREGILRMRRSPLDDQIELKNVIDSIGRFMVMAQAYTGGKVKIVPHVSIESEPVRFEAPGQMPFTTDFIREYFTARINMGGFEAEDQVYRGPFKSALFVHSGMTASFPTEVIVGTPVTGIPYFQVWDQVFQNDLARAMYNAFVGHVSVHAQRDGYPINEPFPAPPQPDTVNQGPLHLLSTSFMDASMWAEIAKTGPADIPERSPTRDWAAAKENPLLRLPMLTSDDTRALGINIKTGYHAVLFQKGEASHRLSPNAAYETFELGGTTYHLLNLDSLDLAKALLPDSAKPQGWIRFGTRQFILLESGLTLPATTPAASSDEQAVDNLSFESGSEQGMARTGNFVLQTFNDPDRGSVLRVLERGFNRKGYLRMLGTRDQKPLFDIKDKRYLEFWVRSTNPEPVDLRVAGLGTVRMFGSLPVPSELAQEPDVPGLPVMEVEVPQDKAWHHVVIDLQELGAKESFVVTDVSLTQAPNARYWELVHLVAPVLWIDDFRAVAAKPGELSPKRAAARKADPASADPQERMLFAAGITQESSAADKAAAIGLMKDRDDTVSLNAVHVFTRVVEVQAESVLGDLARNLNPLIAEQALRALAHQGTANAEKLVRQALEIGPFEHNRRVAAELIARKQDPMTAGQISVLIGSPMWRTRLTAAKAIANLPGARPAVVLLAFLNDVDPQVRLFVAENADYKQDVVQRRLAYYAVHDPSDAIRAASAIGLIKSGVKASIDEGMKALNDPSPYVQLKVRDYLQKNPSPGSSAAAS